MLSMESPNRKMVFSKYTTPIVRFSDKMCSVESIPSRSQKRATGVSSTPGREKIQLQWSERDLSTESEVIDESVSES